jgi:hypothetical protein
LIEAHVALAALRELAASGASKGDALSGGNEVHQRHPLNPKIVTDDEQLALAIDEYLKSDITHHAHREKIHALEDELRRRMDGEAWKFFLTLDEADAARMTSRG